MTINSILIIFLFVWLAYGMVFLLYKKIKLQKKYGFDKSNNFFLKLSKDDVDANIEVKKLAQQTNMFVFVGLIIGFAILLIKYFGVRF